MSDAFEVVLGRFSLACAEFERRLRLVRVEQWSWPTPCTEWNVRQLVNHVTRGHVNYAALANGGTAAEFLRRRDEDALGSDPVEAYTRTAGEFLAAFGQPGALERILDYPLGKVVARQAVAVRATDIAVHAWDLARAVGVDEALDPGLVAWIDENLEAIYAGMDEMPTSARTTHRFFAAPDGSVDADASRQIRLLVRLGRKP